MGVSGFGSEFGCALQEVWVFLALAKNGVLPAMCLLVYSWFHQVKL